MKKFNYILYNVLTTINLNCKFFVQSRSGRITIFLFTFILWHTVNLQAQGSTASRSLILNITGGYGYYIKSFVSTADEKVKLIRPGTGIRVIWQPEHRLRLGLESGYISFYSVSGNTTGNNGEFHSGLGVLPLFLYFGMKVDKNIDVTFSTGGALLRYRVDDDSPAGVITSKEMSFSNFNAGIQWHRPLSDRVEAGAVINYLFLGKTRDSHISAQFSVSVKLLEKKLRPTLQE